MTSSRTAGWHEILQRPFARLVQLFIFRVFHGTGEDSDDLDFGMGLVLALLALPGGFTSIILFNKYATFLQWMRGAISFDPLAAALPDEYFFIVLSMSVTAGVAVWKWESIFPDRRDFMNLVPLPIPLRSIFFANLLAILFLAGILAIDVNCASAVLYPTVVSASQQTFRFYAEFAAVHAITVTLASIFAFMAVFAVLGLAMAILPPTAFRRFSPYLRVSVIVCLFTLLATTSAVSNRLFESSPDSLLRVLPSAWFLGFCQLLRHRANPAQLAMARSAIYGFFIVPAIAIAAYALGYRRHFIRIPEMWQPPSTYSGRGFRWLGALLDRTILRTPIERACVRFIYKTLFRSERHGLIMAGLGGLGVVLASQALVRANEWQPAAGDTILSADTLSIPLILAFCLILALRLAFEIPIELRANWTFRFLLDDAHHECRSLARLAILLAVLPPIILIGLPLYAWRGGWPTALMHTALVITLCVLLTELLLVRFRKVPFTCALPVFRQHAVVGVLAGVFGFFFFAIVPSDYEHWALARPPRMMIFLIPIAGVLALIRYLRLGAADADQRLVFEEIVPSVFDGLLRLEE